MEEPRTYRGISAAERQAQRREKLMDAGLQVFGTDGYAGSSVRGICAVAGLNSRYFYESFESREDLLYAVYQKVVVDIFLRASEDVVRADTIEGKARAGLLAGWTSVTEDRRKAKVVAIEVVGVSGRLERLRRDARHALAKLTADQAVSLAGDDIRLVLEPELVARFLMGGVVEILLDWINGDVHASPDRIVDHFTAIFAAAAYAAVVRPEGGQA